MSEQQLGRYRLVSLLATGGMGEVFLARQEGPGGFEKDVVVKRILRHLAQDQGFIDLFLNEARLAALLSHPNIAQVYGLEHDDDTWFIAMEYVHGRSLRGILEAAKKQGVRMPAPLAVRLCSQALQGLHFAHELADAKGQPLGLVHRDVSPENLLVAFSGQVKLVDFGIAKAMSGAVTFVGRPKGKLAYVAPEMVAANAAVDRRADVFAMGVVLHEALTLERPASSPTTVDELGAPRAPYAPRPDVPGPVNDALARALAPDPADRFPTAAAMSAQLETWLTASGHAVLPGDVTSWLGEVFGHDVVEAANNTPLGSSTARTDVMAVYRQRTEPLAGPPRTEPVMRAVTAPLAGPPAAAPTPKASRTQATVALVVGSLTALAVLVPAVATVASNAGRGPLDDVGAVGPRDRIMPVLDLGPRDGGSAKGPGRPEVRRPPKRPVVRTGRVDVRVNPWAEVLFNGRSYGTTPFAPIEAPAGLQTFTLRNPKLGVVKKVTVKVEPGKTVQLKADLRKRR